MAMTVDAYLISKIKEAHSQLNADNDPAAVKARCNAQALYLKRLRSYQNARMELVQLIKVRENNDHDRP